MNFMSLKSKELSTPNLDLHFKKVSINWKIVIFIDDSMRKIVPFVKG